MNNFIRQPKRIHNRQKPHSLTLVIYRNIVYVALLGCPILSRHIYFFLEHLSLLHVIFKKLLMVNHYCLPLK